MISENALRGLIKLYCLHIEEQRWNEENPKKFRKLLNEIKEAEDYSKILDALKLLYSGGENVIKFHLKSRESLKQFWENFLKAIISSRPEELRRNIDDLVEQWRSAIKGAGRGIITEALAFYYPDFFAPWNNTVDWYLEILGLGKPKTYSEVLEKLEMLRDKFKRVCGKDLDFVTLDGFGWWLKDRKIFIQTFSRAPSQNYIRTIENTINEEDAQECFGDLGVELYKSGFTHAWGRLEGDDVPTMGDLVIFGTRAEKKVLKVCVSSNTKLCPEFHKKYWEGKREYAQVFLLKPISGVKGLSRVIPNSEWSSIKISDSKIDESLRIAIFESLGRVGLELLKEEEERMQKKSKSYLSNYFHARGYKFPDHLLFQFYAALKTKGFVILSGLTGTGKTKIALELAELLEMPQLMSASGKSTNAEKEIEILKKAIKGQEFLIYGWEPPGKAKDISVPFIFWYYDSDENDKFYQKVPYGLVVSDVITGKENLPEDWKSGLKWVEEAYGEDIRKYINNHEIFFKVWKVIECGKDISEFYDLKEDRYLNTSDGSRMQNGYIPVKAPKDCLHQLTNHIFLSVRPDWRDSKPLLGYYNPLDGKYYKTPLLEFILRAKEDYEKNKENAMPYFIILDEMNLAHVEYYFADFLSVLESGRDEDGFTRESIKLHDVDEVEKEQGIPKEIKLPPNLYIIGTVNIDETTYMFSPKVLDRAFTIEFHDVDLESYPPEESKLSWEKREQLRKTILNDLRRNGKFLAFDKKDIGEAIKKFKEAENGKYWEALKQLNRALEPYDLHFGYRVVDEIALFFVNAKESQEESIVSFENDDEIFDLAILMKILPKFHGNRKKIEKPLLLLLKLAKEGELKDEDVHKTADELFKDIFGTENWQDKSGAVVKELTNPGNYVYRHTAKKVLRMLRQLYEIGFASFS